MIIILFSIVFVDFVFARGLDEKNYCTYSFTLVNKKKIVRSFVQCTKLDKFAKKVGNAQLEFGRPHDKPIANINFGIDWAESSSDEEMP